MIKMQLQKTTIHQIASLKNLPTLPQIHLKLIETCNKDRVNVKEISEIVQKDPSLSCKIMGLANSVYSGVNIGVKNMEQAVARIGTSAIRSIVCSNSAQEAFYRNKGKEIFNLKRFWWHSLKCAVLARLISKKISYSQPDEAFLSGLLHDIGKLVLWVNFPEQYKNLLEIYKDQHDLLLVGEKKLDATHYEVGACLLDRWNFQSFITDSVLYHHEPKDRISNAFALVKIVYVANTLAQDLINEKENVFQIAAEIFEFSGSEVEELLSLSDKEVEKAARSLHIEIGPGKEFVSPIDDKNLEKREDLLRDVQDISLLLGIPHDLSVTDDQDAILKMIQLGLQILFNVKNVLFFLYSSEKDVLIGKIVADDKKDWVINNQIIPMYMQDSLLIRSLYQRKLQVSFTRSDDPSSIISDEQIIRLMGKEGLICLPMHAHEEKVGIIVIGLDQVEFSHLSEHIELLTMFANQAALFLNNAYHLEQSRLKTSRSEELKVSSVMALKMFHEINNPLGVIKNYLNILGQKLSKLNIDQDEIRIINEEIDRAAYILREFIELPNGRFHKKEPIDVNGLLSDLVKVTREFSLKNSKIEFHLDLDPSISSIMSNRNRMKQVFINLIQNAVEAMSKGGNLYISTRYAPDNIHPRLKPDTFSGHGYAEITIRDDGPGIPNTLKSQLFEPFITSKGAGHAGLGLSIVYNTVKELKGTITCESNNKNGTCFRIVFSLVQNQES
ncbi:MAG: HDOD domain-containing protein [Deltaproteobacteria bacterium]|nr:HDOD domain-containing protein [Deltaproteobacteria bacterium]